MDIFLMVFLIVLVCVGADTINKYIKAQKAKPALNEDLEAELDELRERIEVLEKIITDEKYQLSRDINALES
ncbi:MAG: hypothetical protein AAF541_02055 [Pseudomonadota bacterium]